MGLVKVMDPDLKKKLVQIVVTIMDQAKVVLAKAADLDLEKEMVQAPEKVMDHSKAV